MKSCTDIEQSKKLAEFLPFESADMKWFYWKSETDTPKIPTFGCNEDIALTYKNTEAVYIPCWSLATLMNLLPSEFTEKGKYSETTYKIAIRKYKFTDDVDLYQIAYGSIRFDVDGQYSFKDMINTGEKEDLIDAAFQMVCWLKENNKL